MNIDEVMSESQDGSGPPAATAAGDSEDPTTSWDTKKFREDYDNYKNKLSDQMWSPYEYPDPLKGRTAIKSSYFRQFPKATVERLEKLVARVERESA